MRNDTRPDNYWRELTLCVIFLIVTFTQGVGQERGLAITPKPQEVTVFEQSFRVTSDTKIVLGLGTTERDEHAAAVLNQQIEASLDTPLKVVRRGDRLPLGNEIYFGNLVDTSSDLPFESYLDLDSRIKIGDQGYFLHVSDSLALILARKSQGLFYGAQTLRQLIAAADSTVRLPGVEIFDWPEVPVRGVGLDVGSGQIPIPDRFKEIVEFLSKHKLNTLMLYLGTRFPYENVTVNAQQAIPENTVTELLKYAREHHVQVVPAIETLSGLEELLIQPEYLDLAEFPGASTINPLSAETYQLFDDMIFEISETFDAPFIYIGGRRDHQIGWHASGVQLNDQPVSSVLANHIVRIHEIAAKYGKQILLDANYFDHDLAVLLQLPEDVVLLNDGRSQEAFARMIESRGLKSVTTWSLSGGEAIFPDYIKGISSIQKSAKNVTDSRPDGLLISHQNSEGYLFPDLLFYGYAFAAECAWSPTSADPSEFAASYAEQFFGTRAYEVELAYSLLSDLEQWSPWSRFWRHPFSDEISTSESWEPRRSRLQERMSQVLTLLDIAATKVDKNRQHLDYLRLAANHGLWLSEKIKLSNDLRNFQNSQGEPLTNGSSDESIAQCLKLVESLTLIQEELQILWVQQYSVQAIRPILDIYTAQIDYLQEIVEGLQRGHLDLEPAIQSEWIYHISNSENDNPNGAPHAFFRKTFDVRPGFRKAYLQAVADTHAKIYLNGGYLDEVMFFRTDKPSLRESSVKTWDVTSLLQPGKNVIAVEAWNYEPNEPAGINLFGQIDYEFGRSDVVLSDPYWKTSATAERNWQNLGFFDVQWLNPASRPKDLIIIQPNFRTSRRSRIEFHQDLTR